MKDFFNTTGLVSDQLLKEVKNATSQRKVVTAFMKKNKKHEFTRSEIAYLLKRFLKSKIGRHEVGRCLSNMLNDNEVKKSAKAKISKCGVGKPEHSYKYLSN